MMIMMDSIVFLSVHSLVVCFPLYFGGCYFMDSFALYAEVRKLGISSNHVTLVLYCTLLFYKSAVHSLVNITTCTIIFKILPYHRTIKAALSCYYTIICTERIFCWSELGHISYHFT